MPEPSRRLVVTVGKIVLASATLAVLLAWQPIGAYAAIWRQISPAPVFFAYALIVPMVLLRGLQTRYLARLQGMLLGLWPLIELQLATAFYGLFLPGVVAAGVMRWYRLTQMGGEAAGTLVLVTFSRLLEIEVTLLLGLAFWLLDRAAPGGSAVPLGLAALFGATAAAQLAIFNARTAARLITLAEHHWPVTWVTRVRRHIIALLAATGRYSGLTSRVWATLVLTTFLGQMLGLLSLMLLASALGMSAGWATLGWARAVLVLALLLPVTWGGIGLREITLAGALAAAGQPVPATLALGLLLSLRGLIEAGLGGLVELRAWLAQSPHAEVP